MATDDATAATASQGAALPHGGGVSSGGRCHPTTDVRQSDRTDSSDVGAFLQDGFFLRNGTLVAIVNTREQMQYPRSERWGRYQRYATATWSCALPGGRRAAARVAGGDPQLYTLVVGCLPPPAVLQERVAVAGGSKPGDGVRVQLEAVWGGAPPAHPAETFSFTVCPARSAGIDEAGPSGGGGAVPSFDALSGRTLVACTMERSVAGSDRVPEWIAHHLGIGFEHFIVYVNGPITRAAPELQRYAREGKLTIVPWYWGQRRPPNGRKSVFMDQLSAFHDCLWRLRGRTKWVAIMDVDEYFQPMGAHASVTSVLAKYEGAASTATLGGLQTPSINFGRCKGDPPRASGASILSSYLCRHPIPWPLNTWKEKTIFRPEGVQYMKVSEQRAVPPRALHRAPPPPTTDARGLPLTSPITAGASDHAWPGHARARQRERAASRTLQEAGGWPVVHSQVPQV